ncbi:N-acetyltransferase 10, partial [Dimargaris xerosporica]
REKKIRREVKNGLRQPNDQDPFELFITVTDIRYTYYKETHKVLGNTFGMCVLQDFEALTPNLLARTIETVEGGGMVVLLLKSMASLKQLYTMTMDVHSRYRTEAHQDVVARFNERFILSLGSCDNCLVVDDELNVLPISMGKHIQPTNHAAEGSDPSKLAAAAKAKQELKQLQESLADVQPVGTLVNQARTVDQAKAIMTFVDSISEKMLRSTVTLTAARGRGKSAALGIAMASAIAYGYSNIFVTSPSPENLNTLFEFVFKGFDALGYEEHMDYDIVQSTNPDFNKAIVRVNVFKQHRQTIQYIQPQDAQVLGQAELLVIDEAAAIPLPLVRKLLGPYLVFMASTINGYEGTGRSLSLKLIQRLREQSRGLTDRHSSTDAGTLVARDGKAIKHSAGDGLAAAGGGRVLREIKLEEPIRYATGDKVEKWLNRLLCLDATIVSKNIQGCPHPSECELFFINRDTLFSYHPVSETFLQRIMSLYVASHYKNTPNDLQLMSDAPAHQLFVLLPPVDASANALPDPLCVIQVCLEGQISRQTILNSLNRGIRAGGDLIPWLMSQQFQDNDFAQLSGARIVRIATHPDYAGMGYGSRALEQLRRFYSGEFHSLSETNETSDDESKYSLPRITDADLAKPLPSSQLHTETVKVRDPRKMPPLLLKLTEKRAPRLHYLGVSYGLTGQLYKFWTRAEFVPVYLRQTANDLTGEHTCVMLRALPVPDAVDAAGSSLVVDKHWVAAFARDFHRRFLTLLSYQFSQFASVTALNIVSTAHRAWKESETAPAGTTGADSNDSLGLTTGAVNGALQQFPLLTRREMYRHFSPYDLKRLETYSNNLSDHHVIMDLLPIIARLYYNDLIVEPAGSQQPQQQRGRPITLSGVQSTVLLAMGLQHKSVDDVSKELHLPVNQVLGMLTKLCKKIYLGFKRCETRDAQQDVGALDTEQDVLMMAAANGVGPAQGSDDSAESGDSDEASSVAGSDAEGWDGFDEQDEESSASASGDEDSDSSASDDESEVSVARQFTGKPQRSTPNKQQPKQALPEASKAKAPTDAKSKLSTKENRHTAPNTTTTTKGKPDKLSNNSRKNPVRATTDQDGMGHIQRNQRDIIDSLNLSEYEVDADSIGLKAARGRVEGTAQKRKPQDSEDWKQTNPKGGKLGKKTEKLGRPNKKSAMRR